MITPIERKRLNFKEDYTYLNRNMIFHQHSNWINQGLLNCFNSFSLTEYPDMRKPYRLLSEYLKRSEKEILITRGVEGSIKQVFETFNLFNKSVAITTPNYAMYNVYAKVYGANLVTVSGTKPDYKINIEQIKKIIPKVKVLFLDNPKLHMPNHFSHAELDEILNVCQQNDTVLFLDEVYCGWETESYALHCSNYDNLIISSGLSKIGFPSLKIGWLTTNVNLLNKLESTRLSYELDSFSCNCLVFLLQNNKYLDNLKNEVLSVKKQWIKTLSKQSSFQVFDSKSFVIRLFSADEKLVKDTYNNLKNEKVIVSLIDNTSLVFSVSTDEEIEKRFFKGMSV